MIGLLKQTNFDILLFENDYAEFILKSIKKPAEIQRVYL